MYDVVFIGERIESPGFKSIQLKADDLLKCRGEVGDFHFSYRDHDTGEMKEAVTGAFVVNLPPLWENPVSGENSFTDELPVEKPGVTRGNMIFIQDFNDLSPAIMSELGLKKVLEITKRYPDIQIYYFYRSLRFVGENDLLFEKARLKGVTFLKYEKGNLELEEYFGVSYQREDISLRIRGQIFIAPQLKPAGGLERLARVMNLKVGEEGFLQPENVYLQPTLSSRRGVYLVGGSRGPTAYSSYSEEIDFTLNEIEALQTEIDPLVADRREVDDQKCVLCYTCYRICPHGAVERDEELDAMRVLDLACQGCNACISHCPAGAISLLEKIETGSKEEKETEVPVNNGSGLKVLLCENSAETAWFNLPDREQFNELIFETIPCAGSIEKKDIYRYLADNERLLILGCFEESCKHLTGDQKSARIVEEINQELKALNLGEDRVSILKLAPRMDEDLAGILSQWKEGD